MTDTPTREQQLLHLADRARRGVALPAEHDALHQGITAMAERAEQAEADHARVHERACRAAERLRKAEQRAEQAEDAIERVRAELHALNSDTRLNPVAMAGRRDAVSRVRAALDQPQQTCVCGDPSTPATVHRTDGPCYIDQPQQPGCEHCGASVSHLPSKYMKGGTVGYCHGELTTEQQPTT